MIQTLTTYRRRAFIAGLSLGLSAGILGASATRAAADENSTLPTGVAPAGLLFSTGPIFTRVADDAVDLLYAARLPVSALPDPTAAQPPKKGQAGGKAPIPPGSISVRRFQHVRWSPSGNKFRSTGSVQVVYKNSSDPTDKGTTLTAQDVNGDAETGQMEASGGIRIERVEGTITGQTTKYNFISNAGYVTDAIAITDFFRMSGKRIETQADGSYSVIDGNFTTCVNGRPDYRIQAHRLSVNPNRLVTARNISFYAGSTRLISLPSFRRNLQAGATAPFPTIGYNKTEGMVLQYRDSPLVETNRTLDYQVRANFTRHPTGYLAYQLDLNRTPKGELPPRSLVPYLEDPLRGFLEQLNPPTYRDYVSERYLGEPEPRTSLFAAVQWDQSVYNRQRTDLVVSRYPQVGVRFANVLGHSRAGRPAGAEQDVNPVGSTEAALTRIPNAPFLMDFALSFGFFRELPTDVHDSRLSLRTDIASQPIIFGKRLSWRLGATNWLSAYGNGNTYNLLSMEAELNYVPTRTSIFGVGYRFLDDDGNTPFVFDHRDIRHELRLRYQVGGPWAFGISTSYDLERSRNHDTELAVIRNFDCMQVGLAYRVRSQSLNVVFNLLPPITNRARRLKSLPVDIGQTDNLQLRPLSAAFGGGTP